MKRPPDVNSLTGVQRAAVLLLSLGEVDAAEVLKHMDAKEVQKLGLAMATMGAVSREQVAHVMEDFSGALDRQTSLGVGADDYIRAVLVLPLGSPELRDPVVVMANVLGGAEEDLTGALLHVFARDRAARVHLYGKEVTPGRKVGHVTCGGTDLEDVRRRAWHAANYLMGDPDA